MAKRLLITALAFTTALGVVNGNGRDAPAAAAPVDAEPYAGYAFVYFTGEGTANGEQIYLAASRGNDPLKFDELNNGQPILTSTLGKRHKRHGFDP